MKRSFRSLFIAMFALLVLAFCALGSQLLVVPAHALESDEEQIIEGRNASEGIGSSARSFIAELIGTGLLLAVVVGSGIMAERLSAGNLALALTANSLATGAGLIALILAFGPISGAHFNPVVTLVNASLGGLQWRQVPGYIVAQITGAFCGVGIANLIFEEPLYFASHHPRHGTAQIVSEFVATFGLLSVILGCAGRRSEVVPFAVGAYITAAYWFTSSTSFANPAVTLARSVSDTFTGIRPVDVPAFLAAQFVGAAAAAALFRWLTPSLWKKARVGL